MTKADLVSSISDRTGIEKDATLTIIEELMSTIKDSLISSEDVHLRGFGSFEVKHRNLRHFHYAPGKFKIIPAHSEPVFKPSQEFKKMI